MKATKKQLTQLNKFKKAQLPILETALINSDSLTACNLGSGRFEVPTWYQLEHGLTVTGSGCIPIAELVKIAKKYDIDSITFDEKFKAELTTGAGSFFIMGEDPKEFPTIPKIERQSDIKIDISTVSRLKTFTSSDDLRPAMQGIFFDAESNEAVATDGHRMRWEQLGSNLKFDSFILPNCAIDILTCESYNHYPANNDGHEIIVGGNERVIYQSVNEKYPNFKSVIPRKDSDMPVLDINADKALKAIEAALIVCNQTSYIIELKSKNKDVYIYTGDIDTNQEFKSEPIGFCSSDDDIRAGFNGKLFQKMLKDFKKEDKFEVTLTGKNRAALINDTGLLMPVMLDSYA